MARKAKHGQWCIVMHKLGYIMFTKAYQYPRILLLCSQSQALCSEFPN